MYRYTNSMSSEMKCIQLYGEGEQTPLSMMAIKMTTMATRTIYHSIVLCVVSNDVIAKTSSNPKMNFCVKQ